MTHLPPWVLLSRHLQATALKLLALLYSRSFFGYCRVGSRLLRKQITDARALDVGVTRKTQQRKDLSSNILCLLHPAQVRQGIHCYYNITTILLQYITTIILLQYITTILLQYYYSVVGLQHIAAAVGYSLPPTSYKVAFPILLTFLHSQLQPNKVPFPSTTAAVAVTSLIQKRPATCALLCACSTTAQSHRCP